MSRNWRFPATSSLVALALSLVGLAQTQSPAPTQSPVPEFRPDYIFQGSQLTGWRPVGDADWRAENGEIIGTPRPGTSGGWLILEKSYQDVAFYSKFRCASPCKTGLLVRAEQTPAGLKGLFVSVAEGDLASYKVTLDPNGKELTRERLQSGGGQARSIADPAAAGAAGAARGGGGGGAAGGGGGGAAGGGAAAGRAGGGGGGAAAAPNAPAGAPGAPAAGAAQAGRAGGAAAGGRGGGGGRGQNLPIPIPALEAPRPGIWANEWNELGLNLDSNVLRPYLNRTNQIGFSNSADNGMGYGIVALYAGGTGEVRFNTVAVKDLSLRPNPAEVTSNRFRMQRLEAFYYAWGAAAADINRDGNLDVIAGPYFYLGPTYTIKREYYLGQTFSPSNAYVPNMVTHAADFTGDGWPDILATEGRALALYVNPKGANRRWERFGPVVPANSELTLLRDVDGDGTPEVVMGSGGALAYAKPDPANPTAAWVVTPISETGMAFGHGLGVGDVNGDGRMDMLGTAGWWEGPPRGTTGLWKYHAQAFGRWGRSEGAGGGEIAVYDVNGDRLNDVVTSLHAHGLGLAWYEQKRAANGDITFVEHMVMDNMSTKNAGDVFFSELHAAGWGDIDGDGVNDFITGKRFWAHQESYTDVDPMGPAVLYVYRTVRNPRAPGGAELVPELVHNKSGVGSQIAVADLNKDGVTDIITSAKLGTYIFWGIKR